MFQGIALRITIFTRLRESSEEAQTPSQMRTKVQNTGGSGAYSQLHNSFPWEIVLLNTDCRLMHMHDWRKSAETLQYVSQKCVMANWVHSVS